MALRLRVSVMGTLGTASDWSNTLEFALGSGIPDQTTLQTILAAARATLAASANFKGAICSDTALTVVKGLYYPTGSGTATLVGEAGGAAVAGAASPVHAPQVCVVASLRTGGAGASMRGRLFVPARFASISALGVVGAAGITAVAAYAQAIASAVISACAASGIAASWCVYSTKLGALVPVTNILVGSQCDTIRHRNRNRNETYTATPVSTTEIQAASQEQADAINALKNAQVEITDASDHLPGFVNAALDALPPAP